jgi:hypothetical protein
MTIKANDWYRVKATHQYCFVQKIPSTRNPQVSIPSADENTRGFEVAVEWYAAAGDALKKWTKRVMILDLKKALALLRVPMQDDLPTIARLKAIAPGLPVSAASRDGEFTWPV